MVVAQLGVLVPLGLTGEPKGLPVLHIVVARVVLEYLNPGVAHEVPGADGRHQVPDVCSELNEFLYLRLGFVNSTSLLPPVSIRVIMHGGQGHGVDHVHVDGGRVGSQKTHFWFCGTEKLQENYERCERDKI